MNDWKPSARMEAIKCRAELTARVRDFFRQRGVVEVSTPAITACGVTDPNIDSIQLADGRFLRTSPEYWHKRLLAAGFGDLYEIGPVFRAGESGHHHQPEFTLLEWYRVGWSWQPLAAEVASLIQDCLDRGERQRPVQYLSWNDGFRQRLGIDGLTAVGGELEALAVDAPPDCSRDMLLDYLFATRIQPSFDPDTITVVYDYPAAQAALARIRPGQTEVAERFEVFVGPLELANGYGELSDAEEQLSRFQADNRTRKSLGRRIMPIDTDLIEALRSGLPACAGVALGMDRLVMMALDARDIREVITFPPGSMR